MHIWIRVAYIHLVIGLSIHLSGASDTVQYRLVFESNYRLYHMNLDGTDRTRLTEREDVIEAFPEWSPDGRQIVFSSVNSRQQLGEYQIDIVSTVAPDVIQFVTFAPGNFPLPIQWSPDGQWIVFRNYIDYKLYAIRPTGKDLAVFMDGEYASWSPNGEWAATIRSENGQRDIFIENIFTKEHFKLTDDLASEAEVVWSPNSSQLVFNSDQDESFDLYRINMDGTNSMRLTTWDGIDELTPAWSPNGRWIAFTIGDFSRLEGDLQIISSDGELRFFDRFDAAKWQLEWLPDSSGLLFYRIFTFPDPTQNYSAIYLLNADCLESFDTCDEADLTLIPHTETVEVTSYFDISPIKLPSE